MATDDAADETFEQVQSAGASSFPVQCSSLKKSGHVLLKNHPCKIMEMSTSKTGKHGHAKVHLVGIDIFTGKKYEDICPSTHNMLCPVVKRIDFQLVDIDDEGYLSLMNEKNSDLRSDLKLPDSEVGNDIKKKFDSGEELMVTIQCAMGQEIPIAVKPQSSKE